jgi:hypothetical protein
LDYTYFGYFPNAKIPDLGDLDTDRKIIIKCILNILACGLDSSGPGQGLLVGCCEHGKSSSIKYGAFLGQMSDC